jgi:TRAP-type C4-dicarboxylate transport system permease small subunit
MGVSSIKQPMVATLICMTLMKMGILIVGSYLPLQSLSWLDPLAKILIVWTVMVTGLGAKGKAIENNN